MSSSICHLFEYAPSYMPDINQSWYTPWHDLLGPTILKLGVEGIDS